MKKSILFISSLLVFGSAFCQMQPAIHLENIKPGKNCFEDYYNAFATRGANMVTDGEQNIVIAMRQGDSCFCVEGKVTVKDGNILPQVLVKKVDGSYESARRTLDSRTNTKDHSLGNPFSIYNGMSQTFSTAHYAVVNLFFVDYLKANPVAAASAPNPDAIENTTTPASVAAVVSATQKGIIANATNGLVFKNGSAIIATSSYERLNLLAIMLVANPNYKVAVNGYTDNTGNAEGNLALSQKRADAVKAYLISKGINANNLTATGFGIANPIDDNNTAAGRVKNRRVEFIVTP